jgi:hypothetical protein
MAALLVASGGVACGRWVDVGSGRPLPCGLLPMAHGGLHLRRRRIRRCSWTHGEIRWSSWIRRCSWIRWCSLTHVVSGDARGSGVRWGEVWPPWALSSTPAAPSPPSPVGCAPGDGVVAGQPPFPSLTVDDLCSSPSTAGAVVPPSTAGAACPGVAVLGVVACPGGDPGGGGGQVANPTAAAVWWWPRLRWLSPFFCFLRNVYRACE